MKKCEKEFYGKRKEGANESRNASVCIDVKTGFCPFTAKQELFLANTRRGYFV